MENEGSKMSEDNKDDEEKAKVWLMGQKLAKSKFIKEAYEMAQKEFEDEEREESGLEEKESKEENP